MQLARCSGGLVVAFPRADQDRVRRGAEGIAKRDRGMAAGSELGRGTGRRVASWRQQNARVDGDVT